MTLLTPRVLIIGAGATGAGLLRDLALRGVQALLIEQRDVNSGASGGNHGLLHSGARYVASDREAAVECREGGDILRRLAPQGRSVGRVFRDTPHGQPAGGRGRRS